LRHSHASSLLSNGVPIAVVSERLGHRDQNITLSIYSHALPADTKAAAKIWNDAMSDVIADARKPAAERRLANVCTRGPRLSELFEKKRKRVAGTTGLEPATSDVTVKHAVPSFRCSCYHLRRSCRFLLWTPGSKRLQRDDPITGVRTPLLWQYNPRAVRSLEEWGGLGG
jgi:hypothetical protein